MNILIVGNGFDLAHDLPTRYTDFLDFLKYVEVCADGKAPEFEKDENSYISRYLISHVSSWKIKRIYSLIDRNVWYAYFKELLDNNSAVGKNWIDFESEIRKVIEFFDRQSDDIYSYVKRPLKQSHEAEEFYSKYVQNLENLTFNFTYSDFIDKSYSDLQKLTQCLEFYLSDCIERFANIRLRSPDIMNINANAVLSFNYTHTFEKLYIRSHRTADIHFIHGSINSGSFDKESNMVLGVNEYWDRDEKDTRTNFNLYKKFVQRIIKDTGIKYKHWLDRRDKDVDGNPVPNNVYIFGHSLDVTDKDVLNEIITADGITSTTIFYRNKQQQAEQIANLSKILGQDRLLEYVNSVNPRIIFKKQQDMIEIPESKE